MSCQGNKTIGWMTLIIQHYTVLWHKQIIHNVDNVRIVEQLQGTEMGKASRSLSVVSCDDEFSYWKLQQSERSKPKVQCLKQK